MVFLVILVKFGKFGFFGKFRKRVACSGCRGEYFSHCWGYAVCLKAPPILSLTNITKITNITKYSNITTFTPPPKQDVYKHPRNG